MKQFIQEFLKYMIGKYKTTSFGLDSVKFELINRFDRKSLMYGYIVKKWLKQFFELIQMNGYGRYDRATMKLVLNTQNDEIVIWLAKHGIKIKS